MGITVGIYLTFLSFLSGNYRVFGIMTFWGQGSMGGGWVLYLAGYKYDLNRPGHSILLDSQASKWSFPRHFSLKGHGKTLFLCKFPAGLIAPVCPVHCGLGEDMCCSC